MRIISLPSQQEAHNAKLHRSARLLLVFSIACIICTLGVVAGAWWSGPREFVKLPSLIGPDGDFLGSALVVTPELALCAIKTVPSNTSIEFQDHSKIGVTAMRTEALTPETQLTLLRLQSPPAEKLNFPNLAEATNGTKAKAASTDTDWDGALQEIQEGLFQGLPPINVSPGAPVQDSAGAVVGVTGRFQSIGIVISTRRLLKAFPELTGSR